PADKPPTYANFANLQWLPDAKWLLGGSTIDPQQVSSTFELTDGSLKAGWTSLREWMIDQDSVTITPARYLANHLLFEPHNAGRVVIKAHCGWFVVEDPKAEITLCNLPIGLTTSVMTQAASGALFVDSADAEVNHYNHYNRP